MNEERALPAPLLADELAAYGVGLPVENTGKWGSAPEPQIFP
jgi:hypothetical protein